MNEAFDESLKLNPKNPELKAFIAGLPQKEKTKPESSETTQSNPTPSPHVSSTTGGFSIGGQFWSWAPNFPMAPSQNEFYLPVSLWVNASRNFSLYFQTELGVDTAISYSYPYGITNPTYANLSGTTVGAQIKLGSGPVQPFVNLGFNLPSGDTSLSNIQYELPPEFVDVRYQGVTFGISALAGIEISDGSIEYTLRAGYMDPGVFNQTFDLPQGNINNSRNNDTFLLSVNRTQSFENDKTQDFGLWVLAYDPLQSGGMPYFQLGPSFDFYYRLKNPLGFSLDSGVQLFVNSQIGLPIFHPVGLYGYFTYGPLASEPHNFRGPRLYLNPSIAIKQVTLAFQVHYLFPNDYPLGSFYGYNAYYDGGGWLLGFGPVWRIPTGEKSAIKLSANYQKIIQQNAAVDINSNSVDLLYDVFQFGVKYEIGF